MAASRGLTVWLLLAIVSVWMVVNAAATYTSVCDLTGPTLAALTYSNNTVTSPNYPYNYDKNEDCSLTLKTNQQFHVVKVVFEDFWLEMDSSGDCSFDRLEFYDGVSNLDTKIGSFCSETHPEVLYSSGRHMYVKFISDGSTEFPGFSFLFSAAPAEEAAGICRPRTGDIIVKRSSGTIFTPNYPVPFKNGIQCEWIITVPAGNRVKLVFDDFQLPSDSTCDFGSKVVIRDGEQYSDNILGTYCGSSLPPSVRSSPGVDSLRVEFNAGYDDERYSGFKAHFKAVDESSFSSSSECFPGNSNNDDLRLEGSSGTLKSPLYPSGYPPSITCTWVITVPDGKIVKLSFNSFDVDYDNSPCYRDYVEVTDGKFSTSKLIGKYCGISKPDDIRSSGRHLRVHFRSDSEDYILDEGFEARFQAVNKSSGLVVGIVVAAVVFVGVIVIAVCIAKRKQRNTCSSRRQPVAGATAAPEATPMMQYPPPVLPQSYPPPPASLYPPPTVGYVPPPAPVAVPYPAQPPEAYPRQDPPPYPGLEGAPQYPPPGQQYPWHQESKGGPQPSAPPVSP